MECPHCGEEIEEVWERGSKVVTYEAYWVENEDEKGVFEFADDEDKDTMDSQTAEVVCPKCEQSLRYRIEKGRIVIER